MEGTALHTRIIFERLAEHQVPVQRVIHAGGIPRRSRALNQVYANVMNRPVLVPAKDITGLGSSIFAFLAAGTFSTVEDAQRALCPGYRIVTPQAEAVETYERLFTLYRKLYFAMGKQGSDPASIGDVLPELRSLARQ